MRFALLLVFAVPFQTSLAADGDVIIQRDVQSRTATRAPLVPDPNPRVVNPGAITSSTTVEMTDGDFANVSTGMALPDRTIQAQVVNNPAMSGNPGHQSLPGVGATHTGGGAGRSISSQVNQSIQQGLRPLQSLGGR
ncbi:hypothetical protein J7302_22680 [Pseudomonas sp. DB1]|uniref:Fap n=1 Tax=Metapseudomonas boanensis TaxID=2822138 RepID=A0ABS5XMH9_9GAMM|nr:hypothetical protein [Pseudomonas boanensis]